MVLVTNYLSLIFVVLQLVIEITLSRVCNYKLLNKDEIFTGITIDPPPMKMMAERPPYSRLRIHYELTESFTSYQNSEQLKREVLLPAKERLESLISVKNPLQGILRVDRRCINLMEFKNKLGQTGCMIGCQNVTKCSSIEVPIRFLKKCKMMNANGSLYFEGPESDPLIGFDIALITVVEECQDATVAMATSCFLETQLDRPILGILILCRNRINAGEQISMNIATIQHEIIHALGFSADKYAFYRYNDGTPRVSRDRFNIPKMGYNYKIRAYMWNDAIIKILSRRRSSIHRSYEKSVYVMTLPTVLRVAREHFKCPTLDGVDLEEYPILSHFDEYILYNELMTPFLNNDLTKLSKFSLALLKDTGWYDVKFDGVSDFHYSENKGCTIVKEGCYAYMNIQRERGLSILPFCDKPIGFGNIFTCDERRRYFYYCDLTKQLTLDPKFQYFRHIKDIPDKDANFYGGSSSYEYCPGRRVPKNPNSICSDTNNYSEKNEVNILNSKYGKDSVCFENGLLYSFSKLYYGASCQKFYYNKVAKTLEVYFEERTIFCPTSKTYILSGKFGSKVTFNCPNIESFERSIYEKNGSKESSHRAGNQTIRIIYFVIMIYKIRDLF